MNTREIVRYVSCESALYTVRITLNLSCLIPHTHCQLFPRCVCRSLFVFSSFLSSSSVSSFFAFRFVEFSYDLKTHFLSFKWSCDELPVHFHRMPWQKF